MRIFCLSLIGISLFASIHSVSASESIRELLVARPDGFYPPYEMVTDNRLTGFHIDLLRDVGKQLNVKIRFESLPWKRALQMIKNGTVDAITFISKTPEREEFVCFSEGNIISHTLDGFFVLRDRAGDISYSGDLKQLRKYTIGVLAGYTYGSDFDNADFLVKDDEAKVEEQLIKKLLAGRFDIAAGNVARIRYIARIIGEADRIEYLRPFLNKAPNYIGFSKKKNLGQLSERFAETMELFKKTPLYDALVKKYGTE